MPLRISGRITPRGTVTARDASKEHAHSLLMEKGAVQNIDDTIGEVAQGLGREDVVIMSGNAIDVHGNVAMMAGSPGGGNPGTAIPGMFAQGAHLIIPIGLEKLIPGSIQEAVKAAGRDMDLSYGMAMYGDWKGRHQWGGGINGDGYRRGRRGGEEAPEDRGRHKGSRTKR